MKSFAYGRVYWSIFNAPVIEVSTPDGSNDHNVRIVFDRVEGSYLVGLFLQIDKNGVTYNRRIKYFTELRKEGRWEVTWLDGRDAKDEDIFAARKIIAIASAGAFGSIHEEAMKILKII